ncbi:MAG: alpha/beta hydrolase [Candidatus Eremiobacteraeota bacterium]|nr:alpha/beta hydrolase [Candidatus Eremiobacteraeota bacterium]
MRHRQIAVDGLAIHVAETGPDDAPAIVLLHGWPQDGSAFAGVMAEFGDGVHAIAPDLPAIGRSRGAARSYDKTTLAGHIRALVAMLGLGRVILVGHDVGGMIVYAYLRAYAAELRAAVIMDVAIPGIDPWQEVIRNPHIWHFAFHAIPKLPETLVNGHEGPYFDFFFDALAGPNGIRPDVRARAVAAYARDESLRAGFDFYRAFPKDEADNRATAGHSLDTPVLYIRGDHETGHPEQYVAGLRAAGLTNLALATIADCGHFAPDEQPAAVAATLRRFAEEHR